MAPPGRRRPSISILSLLLSLLFLASTVSAQSAVLGIDLGTEYIKAVLVKPGTPLEIVLAKDSKRKEASIVSFKPLSNGKLPEPEGEYPERSYGSAAQALAARFPGDTYPNLKQLLGLPFESSSVLQTYQDRYPAISTRKTEFRDSIAFQSPSFAKHEKPFAIEELLAMQLKNTLQNAQDMAGKANKIRSAVFTIPPFFTVEEKAALELAAELANIKVLAIISDGLAVGINYATGRTFESVNEGAKPEFHMVYDVGAGYTSATVLKMQGRTVKDVGRFNKTIQEVIVTGSSWDRTLGGDALNSLIVEDMATKFIETSAGKALGKTAKDVLSNGRASARLWKDAERLRQVLSANQETGASFEELYEGVDFRYKLSRSGFEAMTTSFAERLDNPFTNALKMANLTTADLDSIILFGGAIRTPFVQKKLETLAGDASKLRSSVNSDEAAALGAAFKAASSSPSFRVKAIRDYDAAIYPTWMQYRKDKEGKQSQQKVFTGSSYIGSTKVFTLPKLEDFEIYLFQNRPTDKGSPFEGGNTGVSGTKYQSVNLTESVDKLVKEFGCRKEDISTQVTMKLATIWGLPTVLGGSVSCEHEVAEPKGMIDGVRDFLGFGKKEESEQKVLNDDGTESTSSSSGSTTESSTVSTSSSASPSASTATAKQDENDKAKEAPKLKKKTEKIEIEFAATHDKSTVIPYAEQKFMGERIRTFDRSDKDRRQLEEDHNNLEAYLYKVRDLLTDTTFTSFASKRMIKDIESIQKITSTWLSHVAGSTTSQDLKSRLKQLEDLVTPIKSRKEEAATRPELTEYLREALKQAKGLVEVIKENLESAKSVMDSSSESSTAKVSSDESASESSSTTTAPAESSATDPLADLEEADESSTTTATSNAPKSTEEPFMMPYTQADLDEMLASYESVNTWLEKKLVEQAKLKEWDDPVLLSADMQQKAKDLNDALMKLLQNKMRKPSSSKSRSKKPKPTKKASKKDEEKKDEKKEEKKSEKKKDKVKDEL